MKVWQSAYQDEDAGADTHGDSHRNDTGPADNKTIVELVKEMAGQVALITPGIVSRNACMALDMRPADTAADTAGDKHLAAPKLGNNISSSLLTTKTSQ